MFRVSSEVWVLRPGVVVAFRFLASRLMKSSIHDVDSVDPHGEARMQFCKKIPLHVQFDEQQTSGVTPWFV